MKISVPPAFVPCTCQRQWWVSNLPNHSNCVTVINNKCMVNPEALWWIVIINLPSFPSPGFLTAWFSYWVVMVIYFSPLEEHFSNCFENICLSAQNFQQLFLRSPKATDNSEKLSENEKRGESNFWRLLLPDPHRFPRKEEGIYGESGQLNNPMVC